MKKQNSKTPLICLAATSGGHFEELAKIFPLKEKYRVSIVTTKTKLTKLDKSIDFRLHKPIMTSKIIQVFGMFLSFIQSFFYLAKYKPKMVISTGSGEMYPLLWCAKKIFHKKIIFIESYARVTSPSKCGKAVYKFADKFIIQWESLKDCYPNSIYLGGLF